MHNAPFNKMIDQLCETFSSPKQIPGHIEFWVDDRKFHCELDLDGWFWTDGESQVSQESYSATACESQEDARVWSRARAEEEREAEEEEEQVGLYGTDREQVNSLWMATRL